MLTMGSTLPRLQVFQQKIATEKHTESPRGFPMLGEQIRVARIAQKMSAEVLAKAVGLTAQNMTNIENNRAVPLRTTLVEIQKILDCSLVLDSSGRP